MCFDGEVRCLCVCRYKGTYRNNAVHVDVIRVSRLSAELLIRDGYPGHTQQEVMSFGSPVIYTTTNITTKMRINQRETGEVSIYPVH